MKISTYCRHCIDQVHSKDIFLEVAYKNLLREPSMDIEQQQKFDHKVLAFYL